jgi:hypothetical protein
MLAVITALTWLVLAGGLIPSAAFLITHRPTRPWRTQAVVVNALVLIPFLLYLRAVIALALNHGIPRQHGLVDSGISILMGSVIDWLFIYMWVRFRQYRAAWSAEERGQE